MVHDRVRPEITNVHIILRILIDYFSKFPFLCTRYVKNLVSRLMGTNYEWTWILFKVPSISLDIFNKTLIHDKSFREEVRREKG